MPCFSISFMDPSVAAARPRSSNCSHDAPPLPEFEFWIAPQPQLHTADELFSDGILLPLHLLRPRPAAPCGREPPPQAQHSPPAPTVAVASVAMSISCSPAWGSRRWRNPFKIGEKEPRRKDQKSGSGGAAKSGISIWPFHRSRSAGSSATAFGARSWDGARKSRSAPCSRSNSRGESSKSGATEAGGGRRRTSSPGRAGGVHVGRVGPVWQIRPGSKGFEPAAWRRTDRRSKVTVGEKLSVSTCIGHRCPVECKGDDRKGIAGGERKFGALLL